MWVDTAAAAIVFHPDEIVQEAVALRDEALALGGILGLVLFARARRPPCHDDNGGGEHERDPARSGAVMRHAADFERHRLPGGNGSAAAGDVHLAFRRHLALVGDLRRADRGVADLLDDDAELREGGGKG
ncbi:MAG: hypothetical protein DMG01_29700, partial [Acidobacteria bacterium]